jgi:hypothetical protein
MIDAWRDALRELPIRRATHANWKRQIPQRHERRLAGIPVTAGNRRKRGQSSLSPPHGMAPLQTRTKHFVAHFPKPFRLAGFAEQQPAGTYALDHREELVEGIEGRPAFRRVSMFMHLPAIIKGRWTLQMVCVEPAEIECAVVVDLEPSPPRSSARDKKRGAQ